MTFLRNMNRKNTLEKHIDQPFTMDKPVNQNGENPCFFVNPRFFSTGGWNYFSKMWGNFHNPWRIHGAAIYGVPWIPLIYPLYVSIYTSTMEWVTSDHPIIPSSQSWRRGSAGLDKKARSAGGRESSGPWRLPVLHQMWWAPLVVTYTLCGWLIMVYKPLKNMNTSVRYRSII